jgi:agmatinase
VHTQAAVDGPPPRPPEAPAAARTRAAERWLRAIGRRVAAALDAGAVPVLLGGEHTVTVAAARVYRRRRLRVGFVQFDAHADLRARYQGTPLSHACAMRRVHDLGFPLFQLATRAYAAEEAAYRRRSAIAFRDAGSLVGPDAAAAMTLPPDFPEAIHITFDVDAFDPAVIPATGTPVPGGLDWYGACRLLAAVTAGRRIVGCDVVELAPNPALPYADFAAALLAYRLMGLAGPGRQRRGERP